MTAENPIESGTRPKNALHLCYLTAWFIDLVVIPILFDFAILCRLRR